MLGVAGQQTKGVWEDLRNCVEALLHPLGASRKVEYEGGTGRTRNSAG